MSPSPPLRPTNGVSSPLLAALGTFPVSGNTDHSDYPTTEWAHNVPFGHSPPDRHDDGYTSGASPPDLRHLSREPRGAFSHASPPTRHAKLARRGSEQQNFGGYLGSSPGRERPVSMHSQRSHAQYPPLPHHPQPHFYTAPDLDFGPSQKDSTQKTDETSYFAFDSLNSAGVESFKGIDSVLLVGHRNGLHVLTVDKTRFERIGQLENLRGLVIGAKILPSATRDDPLHSLRPLVAVIIHGPQDSQIHGHSQQESYHSDDALFDPSGSVLKALQNAEPDRPYSETNYRTTVEIYSLKKGKRVTTLLKSPRIPLEDLSDAPKALTPTPEANLRLEACGRFLVVGLEKSGEVYVFESRVDRTSESPDLFRCIGKTWTNVITSKSRSSSVSSNDSDLTDLTDMAMTTLNRSSGVITSLSSRWLAVVPPSSSIRTTMHWTLETELTTLKPPGLSSHTSSPAPQPTCELDTPEAESMFNRVARDLTQELMKGARWVGDQGMQAWRNYWNKPADPNLPPIPRTFPNNAYVATLPRHPLPPTHANEQIPARTSNQAATVSILDLDRLSENQASKDAVAFQPVATFLLPQGCSLLSFAPGGLSLLTASTKGDVQHVWSLMRMIHGSGLGLQGEQSMSDNGPSVRQIARYTRMTVARIVDVAWTEPLGDKFALVTERGTVHIYSLPPSALQWPPPRRVLAARTSSSTPPKASSAEVAGYSSPASGRFSSAMEAVTGKTQPFLAAVRGRPASTGNPFAGFGGVSLTAGAGMKSGKVVAAGFNKSVGAATGTVNTLRHLGENRLTLPGSSRAVAPGCIKWLGGKDGELIAVTDGSIVRIHGIRESTNQRPGKRRPSVIGSKPVEFNLRNTLERYVGTSSENHLQENLVSLADSPPKGFWTAAASSSAKLVGKDIGLSHAEIETNAPYQPFHTDRRVAFLVYPENEVCVDDQYQADASSWVFGDSIQTEQAATRSGIADADDRVDMDLLGPIENHVSIQGNEEGGQQVVVSTRRRRVKKVDPVERSDVEEFFEDDLEVVDFADERV